MRRFNEIWERLYREKISLQNELRDKQKVLTNKEIQQCVHRLEEIEESMTGMRTLKNQEAWEKYHNFREVKQCCSKCWYRETDEEGELYCDNNMPIPTKISAETVCNNFKKRS